MADISKTPVSDFDAAVRLLSGGTNVAIYNDIGLPSIYVRREKAMTSSVISGGPDSIHYAFRVNLLEVPAFYMGKYLATVYKGRALSLPLQNPSTDAVAKENRGDASSNYVNFGNAKMWCEANGPGFHLPTIAEYAWIALLSRKNGTMPHGNTSYGAASGYAWEKGVMAREFGSMPGLAETTLTGSGPAKWNDNWQPDGICDLCGNVYEWQGGYRTVNGEIQIFADNDAAMQYQQNADSTLWKAILQDGTLVDPGTDGTLKWDYFQDPGVENNGLPYRLNTKLTYQPTSDRPYGQIKLDNLTAADGILVPERLKALAMMPDGGASYGGTYVFMRNIGERLAYRGGCWNDGGLAGVAYMSGANTRTVNNKNTGFRPAFIPGI